MGGTIPAAVGELARLALAIVGFVVALVLIGLGPVGWLLLGVLFLLGATIYGARRRDGGPDLINCPNCGARVPADAETCEHCGDPL